MRNAIALALVFAASLAFVAACNACAATAPQPSTVTVVGDASVDLCQSACEAEATYCPTTMTDGGVPFCVTWCHSSNGKHSSATTTIPALTCQANAKRKAAYVACQVVSTCP